MWTLYHLWLSPQSRAVRILLAEKKVDFTLKVEKTWERREAFFKYNPAGEVPVLVDEKGKPIVGAYAISEFLETEYPTPPLFGKKIAEKNEIRRLVGWFNEKFNREVSHYLINERVMKRFLGLGTPNSQVIRAAKQNIETHLQYIIHLMQRRSFLAGDDFSYADMVAAAHISCIDYLDEVPWDKFKGAKDWYMKVKCRPSFRPILSDHIAGMNPPKHYANLDF